MARNIHADDMLRCKDCHYVTTWFRGWAFIQHCFQADTPSMLHNWELVSKEEVSNDQEAR